jgi:hypothetical protein
MNTAENMIIQFVSVLIQSEIELMAAWRPWNIVYPEARRSEKWNWNQWTTSKTWLLNFRQLRFIFKSHETCHRILETWFTKNFNRPRDINPTDSLQSACFQFESI